MQDTPYPIEPFENKFRVSSLPFCILLYLLEKPSATQDFSSGFFFAQGHALHSLWQMAAQHTLPKQLIGDWSCSKILNKKATDNSNTITRCNRMVKFCSFNKAKQTKCLHSKTVSQAECHAAQHYYELEFEWRGLSGHTDFLYLGKDKKYHLIDFKTTGTFLFDKPEIAKAYYPSKKYIVQLETYVLMLERTHKIKIATYNIAYISRDRAVDTKAKPALRVFSFKVTNELRNKRKATTLKYIQNYKLAKRWQQNKSKKLLNKVWNARPCHNKRDYLNVMAPSFFGDCPKLETCMSGKLKRELAKDKNNAL